MVDALRNSEIILLTLHVVSVLISFLKRNTKRELLKEIHTAFLHTMKSSSAQMLSGFETDINHTIALFEEQTEYFYLNNLILFNLNTFNLYNK